MQVLNLCLARVRTNARYHQICVVSEFEDVVDAANVGSRFQNHSLILYMLTITAGYRH